VIARLHRVDDPRPGRTLRVVPEGVVIHLLAHALDLVAQRLGVRREVVVHQRADEAGDEEATGDPAVQGLVLHRPIDVLKDRPPREPLPPHAVEGAGLGVRNVVLHVQVQEDRSALSGEEHEGFGPSPVERRSRRDRIADQEPGPGPVAAEGHRAEAPGTLGEDHAPRLPHVRKVEKARDSFFPGLPEWRDREAASGLVATEVEEGVNVDEPRPVLVYPENRRSIGPQQVAHVSQAPHELRPLGIRLVEGGGPA